MVKRRNKKIEDDLKDLSSYDQDSLDTVSSLKIMLSTVQEEIDYLKSNGCYLTNIEKGTVHWHSKFEQKDIVLSWTQGEEEDCHWHLSKHDFNNRKPYSSIHKALKETETA